ncbi:gap junction delta-4 protein [Echinops telfairi]|uniref:Gap junction protein n=1 Tax=Echinops telfairi TaxID=9371 RepID=A0ABM0IL42_ECHTE|nr:gap junction delta-4 protein [Echinops telfairi]
MEPLDLLGFLITTLNYNVTIVGKLWLVVMILLRMLMIILAGYPIYQDEQEKFVCNTLQPGCANVCYDSFSPVSHFRFWLLQSVSVLLPYSLFSVYVLHRGAMHAVFRRSRAESRPGGPDPSPQRMLAIPDFSPGYVAHLLLRILIEAAFGTLHYILFGFVVPMKFSCSAAPCGSKVECYVSRPTEKSIMMLFTWGVSGLSFLLSVVDLIGSVRRMGRRRLAAATCRREHLALLSLAGHVEERRPISKDAGWEEGEGVKVPTCPGLWAAEEDAGPHLHSPSEKSGMSGRMELPDEAGREVVSLASEELASAHQGLRGRGHRGVTQDPGTEGPSNWGGPPSAPRSRLAGQYASSKLQPQDRLSSSSSAACLGAKKSEWV